MFHNSMSAIVGQPSKSLLDFIVKKTGHKDHCQRIDAFY